MGGREGDKELRVGAVVVDRPRHKRGGQRNRKDDLVGADGACRCEAAALVTAVNCACARAKPLDGAGGAKGGERRDARACFLFVGGGGAVAVGRVEAALRGDREEGA